MSTAERLLDRWGWPAFFLFLVVLAIIIVAKAIWPLIRSYVTSLQIHAQEAHESLKQVVDAQNDRSERQEREFINALNSQREAHIIAIAEQSSHTKRALGDLGETIGKELKAQGEALHEITIILRRDRDAK